MRFRAVLVFPEHSIDGFTPPDKPQEIRSNSAEDVKRWAEKVLAKLPMEAAKHSRVEVYVHTESLFGTLLMVHEGIRWIK